MIRQTTLRDRISPNLSVSMGFAFAVVIFIIVSDPRIQIGVVLAVTLWIILARAGALTRQNITLGLWALLISHRAFIPRTTAVAIGDTELSDVLPEVVITAFVFFSSLMLCLTRLRVREALKVSRLRFWLIAYAAFALASLIWTPHPLYAAFWLMRLLSVVILIVLYFDGADEGACQRFVIATLIGMFPHIALIAIAFFVSSFSGQRVAGFWFLHGVASILSFSVSMVFLTKMLQGGQRGKRYVILAGFPFVCGFLAGGKTGALGGGIAFIVLLLMSSGWRMRLRALVVVLPVVITIWMLQSRLEVGLFTHWAYYQKNIQFHTLYSRFDLWQGALQMWLDSLWSALFGHGFTAARVTGITTASGAWTTTHAHNAFLQSSVELGLLGAFPIIAMIFIVTASVIRQRRILVHSPVLPLFIGFIVLIVGSFMDHVFGGVLEPPFYLFIGIVVAIDHLLDEEHYAMQENEVHRD